MKLNAMKMSLSSPTSPLWYGRQNTTTTGCFCLCRQQPGKPDTFIQLSASTLASDIKYAEMVILISVFCFNKWMEQQIELFISDRTLDFQCSLQSVEVSIRTNNLIGGQRKHNSA